MSVASIALATVVGFTVGLMRLSRNWLVSSLATVYIEFVRNIPLPVSDFTSLQPKLKQIFYIGDGLNSGGMKGAAM